MTTKISLDNIQTTALTQIGGGASVVVSTTSPESPSEGDLWFNSETLETYIYYNNVWVLTNPNVGQDGASATATTYTNIASFPSTGNTTGDFAIALDTKALYIWNDSEWDRVYTGANETLNWVTAPSSAYSLNVDGTPTIVTLSAIDPDGFDVTYSYDTSPSDQTQATITESGGTFTITPSTNLSDEGEFTLRFKSTDGLHVLSYNSTIELYFSQAIEFLAANNSGISADSTNAFSAEIPGITTNSGFNTSEVLRTNGKYYFEVELSLAARTAGFIGIQSIDQGDVGSSTANTASIYLYSGTKYPDNKTTNFGVIADGGILQFAYDDINRQVWFNYNNGTWVPGDPTTAAGYPIGGTSGFAMTLGSGASAGASFSGNIKTNSTGLVYTPPTGFKAH